MPPCLPEATGRASLVLPVRSNPTTVALTSRPPRWGPAGQVSAHRHLSSSPRRALPAPRGSTGHRLREESPPLRSDRRGRTRQDVSRHTGQEAEPRVSPQPPGATVWAVARTRVEAPHGARRVQVDQLVLHFGQATDAFPEYCRGHTSTEALLVAYLKFRCNSAPRAAWPHSGPPAGQEGCPFAHSLPN